MSVKIRYRKVSRSDPQENYTVYLDIYEKGKRSYEYPQIYVSKDYSKLSNTSATDREKIDLVEGIKNKIELAIRKGEYGFEPAHIRNKDFIAYFEQVCLEKKHNSYNSVLEKLKEFTKEEKLRFANFTTSKVKEFIKFLTQNISENTAKNISENTANQYLKLVNIAFNKAIRERIITENPINFLAKKDKPKKQQTQRVYLTLDELKQLKKTPFHANPQIKQSYLFSCFSGFRISDLKRLRHSDIVDGQLQFRQKKSEKEFLYLPLHDTAKEILKQLPPPKYSDLVFWDLPSSSNNSMNYEIRVWAASAGITKHISWHTGRHSFACNWLASGGDIYYLSKYLGHSSVAITEIYSHVIPKTMQDMVNKIPVL